MTSEAPKGQIFTVNRPVDKSLCIIVKQLRNRFEFDTVLISDKVLYNQEEITRAIEVVAPAALIITDLPPNNAWFVQSP